jgi:uncharacterized membrane protein YkoI
MKNNKILFVGVSLILSSFSLVFASESKITSSIKLNNNKQSHAYSKLAKITLNEAIQKAQEKFSGKVTSSLLENEEGYLVYAINIVNGSSVKEVIIDAGNGSILSSESEDQKNKTDGDGEEADD